MSQQHQQIKKKKKVIKTFSYRESIDKKKYPINTFELKMKIKNLFKNHIGFENGLSGYELLEKVFGSRLDSMNDYEKYFYYDLIKKNIRLLRKDRIIMIINQRGKFFVLKSIGEWTKLSEFLDRDVQHLRRLQSDSYNWVIEKRWENL